jgi:nucleoside-diphosphate-sugar epimerase
MNVYITGANGFLGKYVTNALKSYSNIKTIGRKNANLIADIRFQKFKIFDPIDLFVHIAGKAHLVPKSQTDILEIYKVNVNGARNIIKSLEDNPPKKFVYISSVSVYGLKNGLKISEQTELLAKDPYGLSKIYSEQIILNWCKTNNVICTIFRLPLVVGYNAPGNLGTMLNGIKKQFYFNISGNLAKKSMVLADDVAKHIIPASKIGGIYNLTDGYHPTFIELSNHISIQLGKRKPMNIPFWFAMIISKFGDLLGSKAPLNTKILKKITSDLTFDDNNARLAFGWNPTQVLEGFKLNIND